MAEPKLRATTIVAVRRNGQVALAGDGQVTLGETVVKSGARKIQKLADGAVLAGFAGAVADALTLFDKLRAQLVAHPGNLRRAAVELAKEWRTDRMLRQLNATLVCADREVLLLVTGTGEVIEPDDDAIATGSGGNFALAAARALLRHTDLPAEAIARESIALAAELCIYTNEQVMVEMVG